MTVQLGYTISSVIYLSAVICQFSKEHALKSASFVHITHTLPRQISETVCAPFLIHKIFLLTSYVEFQDAFKSL